MFFLGGCGKEDYSFTQSGQETAYANTETEKIAGVADVEEVLSEEAGEESSGTDDAQKQCYVHICGAIRNPGVYCVAEDSRLYEVILLAGGMTSDAADEAVNQAGKVSDGMQIYIPTRAEVQDGSSYTSVTEITDDGRININTADLEQLCRLPGIGETRAQAILAYRAEHGAFQSVEELMNVTGIKSGVYEKIKDLIRI